MASCWLFHFNSRCYNGNSSPAAASITINGTGSSSGTNSNSGVDIKNTGTLISSIDGNINITGTGAGSGTSNDGIFINDNATITSTGTADISLTGTESQNGSSADGIKSSSGTNTLGSSTMTGNIKLYTGSLNLADITIQNKGSTTISSNIASTTVGIGDEATGGLHISDAELALFNTGSFIFGNTSGSGKMTVAGKTWSKEVSFLTGTGEIEFLGAQSLGTNNISIIGGSLTGGKDITAGKITIDVKDGLDVGTLTSVEETTINFDSDNSGSATASIGSISSGGDITIHDGNGANNIIQISGVSNAGTANASLKADSINVLDTLTANVITLDATGSVIAKVSTDNKLNLSASFASLAGKINGGTGLRAALFGINNLNFTGGNSNFNFGSYKVGFDSREISNRLKGFGSNFSGGSFNASSMISSLADSLVFKIDYNPTVKSDSNNNNSKKSSSVTK